MPSRLGHGLYKKIDRLKNIFRCIYITRVITIIPTVPRPKFDRGYFGPDFLILAGSLP